MVKLYRVLYSGEEFGPKGNWMREMELSSEHACEVVQICFWTGRGQMLTVDADGLLVHWNLSASPA